MTPIKVGEYTVLDADDGSYVVLRPATSDEVPPGYTVGAANFWTKVGQFDTLPMALRFAAEMAGIERQRVELVDFEVIRAAGFSGPPLWHTYNGPDDVDPDTSGVLPKLMDRAHEYARDRYAAHGGAS
jgi:hypothetical protein